MKCQRCKERDANVQIIQQAPGKKPQTLLLCDICATEMGIVIPKLTFPGKMNTNPFFTMGNVFQSNFGLGAEEMSVRQTTECDQCGMTFEEFKQTGFLGCPHCYDSFSPQIDPVFCRTQMGKKHVGRRLGRKPAKGHVKEEKSEDSCDVEWAALEEEMKMNGLGRGERDAISVVDSDPAIDNRSTASPKKLSIRKSSALTKDQGQPSEDLLALEKQHMQRLIEEKKEELRVAVSEEKYSVAAKLRDELEDMNRKMKE
jgi:protein arginine kinase activator